MMQSGKISWSVSIVRVTVKLNILVRRNTDTLELTQSRTLGFIGVCPPTDDAVRLDERRRGMVEFLGRFKFDQVFGQARCVHVASERGKVTALHCEVTFDVQCVCMARRWSSS